jgi:hypothetical protein
MALYSEKALSKSCKDINNGPGFMSSITNQTTFFLKKFSQYNPRVA